MNKWEYKLFNIPNSDLDVALNAEGQLGWRPAHAVQTPFGPKFIMERQLDEIVDPTGEEQAKQDALLKKFGLELIR